MRRFSPASPASSRSRSPSEEADSGGRARRRRAVGGDARGGQRALSSRRRAHRCREHTEPALALFLRSRALVPGKANTTNAAICLEKLGRYDEALDMAEEVIAKFSGSSRRERAQGHRAKRMAELRKKVGSLVVTSDVDATLDCRRPRSRQGAALVAGSIPRRTARRSGRRSWLRRAPAGRSSRLRRRPRHRRRPPPR